MSWPVLRRYDGEHLTRIALPLGGIGTGTVSLGGRGDLRDWEVVNRPAKNHVPANTFFALWARRRGDAPVTRVLEGVLEPPYEGWMGAPQPNHGLPRFRSCEFAHAYPLGQVSLADSDVPLRVRIEAFNPLIPGDAERSGIPVAVLRFVLTNRGRRDVDAAVCGSIQNTIGMDGFAGAASKGRNSERDGARLRGVLLESEGVAADAEQWGTVALSTTGRRVTRRTSWVAAKWRGDALLEFWDDFSHDGRLDPVEYADPGGGLATTNPDTPMASVASAVRVPAGGSRELTFLLTWHFPNRMDWGGKSPVGNWYTAQWDDAWEVAESVARDLKTLEADTVRFVGAVCSSDLPDVVKDAALCTLTAARSQTSFRTPDGTFWGWEGCADSGGCCAGSCTHVWNYEQATALLFGSLARSMRDAEFAGTDAEGRMPFRLQLPGGEPLKPIAAADGQMGCLLKLYRDWQLCGDDAWLEAVWPAAKRALEFAWIPGGWDADHDGVMEGCQHNTMDVEYFGPNPQMGIWYLGALRAAEEIARHLGDDDFAKRCIDLFENGRAYMDDRLFNGEYYEHELRPVGAMAPGLSIVEHTPGDAAPPSQLGPGCLVDQLVGQLLAHVCGLGYLVDAGNARIALASVAKHNFRESFYSHFNHFRSFVLNDESGLLMATYPRGGRPRRPFPYFTEVMTGFEYTAAVGMLYEGLTDEGLRVMEAIRARYDGRRRSPFDEAECGHHYARAMVAWAAIPALTGFHWSAVTQTMQFASARAKTTWFWSNGSAWGTFVHLGTGRVRLEVLHGTLALRHLRVGERTHTLPRVRTLRRGSTLDASV